MESWQNPLFIVLVLTGITFIIMTMIVSKFTPKKINRLYGYRTKSSMKSQERWDFAQSYSNDLMFKYGVLLTLLGIAGYFTSFSVITSTFIGVAIMIILIIALMYQVEKAIIEKYGNE